MKTTCSKCGGPRDREGQRYCRACHRVYMRERRPKWSELPSVARKRGIARATLHVYVGRGKLAKRPCEVCGLPPDVVQAHHEDYSRPLDVHWLCPEHHRRLHRMLKHYGSVEAAIWAMKAVA